MTLTFTKMHGLGNDCVILNALTKPLDLNCIDLPRLAKRGLGIGCDQILVLETSKSQDADFYCRIFNADGSEAGMSGNGLRCLAKFIYNRKFTLKHSFTIATDARIVMAFIENDGQITLDMGQVDFSPQSIPILATERALSYNLQTSCGTFDIGAVSLGNPHAVLKVNDVDKIDIAKIGALISQHSLFPQHTNVNFIQVLDNINIKLRTYERGSGETAACGSGSCAAVAVGRIWQLLAEKVTIHLHYGTLQVRWHDVNSSIFLTGPAVEVFDGIWFN